MGDRLLPADDGNPRGYFEDADFLDLDRRMLMAATPGEAGHRDWGWTESERFDAGALAAFRDEAAALVAARDRAAAPWGWKDPRTTLLLDFWDGVLQRDVSFVLLYRHPWEVAASMLRSGAHEWLTHPDYPARIWTHYNRRLLEFHQRNRERSLLVSANALLLEPQRFAAILRERLGIDADAETIASLRAREAFVSMPEDDPLPRLWHYANAEAMSVLRSLDDAADLANQRTAERKRPLPSQPRVSVIVPCFNDGDYVIDAVASVERNAAAAEVIIVDDGSTEQRTRDVLGALREAGHRVIEQEHAGLSAARNRGIAAASGEFFIPLDADNRLLPDSVEEAVALLDADPAAGVVYGDRREFGARRRDVEVPELDSARMLWSNYIDACAVVRRTAWQETGGYDPAFHDWEDWDFWLGLIERGWKFIHLPRPAFEYRIRPGSLQHQFLQRSDHSPELRRIYAKHPALIAEQAAEALVTAHTERRQLLHDAESLRNARDTIQIEIDRLARSTREIVAARDEEIASLRALLEPPHDDGPLTNAASVFTIIARNYLPFARVLAASLARHNPAVRLHVVVLDDAQRSITPDESFEIIHAEDLPFDPRSDFYTMAATYDVTELATAVKPWAFEALFARGASAVLYLDPDIEVFGSLGPLEALARRHGMVVTPHITEPLPRDGKRPDERDLLLAGIYNLGFLALSADAAKSVLPWWRARLRRDCVNDPPNGFFVDQRWMDFAPALFEPYVLKDAGYNVAYWNLPHRELAREGERIVVDGRPLRFFHFSGFSPRTPHLLSKHQHESVRIRLSEWPLLGELCARYAASLQEAGFAEWSALPYGFATTAAGLPLEPRTRRVLRRSYVADEAAGPRSFPNPFSAEGAHDVVERLLRPSPYGEGVPAWLGEIWSERADLRIAFPRIDSADANRFLQWVRTQGVREHDIPAPLVPPAQNALAGNAPLTRGVNVYGYAYAESGTGQIVRSVVAALAAEGIPYAVIPFTRTISRQQKEFRDLGTGTPSFDTNLICVNADQVPVFFESMREQLAPGARNIGLWAWEVEDLPAAMARSEQYLSEVWGISSFTAAALARCLTKPVEAFPLPVVIPPVRKRTRGELGMPDGFLFLFCFDYDSVFRRKNPLGVIAAFQQAFANRSDAALFIKTTNAGRHMAEHEELCAAAAGWPNIVIRDAYVASDEYFSMLDACDCYVSLHRAEGFGLTVAEAMALGKPVISTAYSSTLEFTNESNSFLVPAEMVEIGEGAAPYPPRTRWAEPDIAAAAQQMLRVFHERGEAQRAGARARADIETLHSPAARGPLLRALLGKQRQQEEIVQDQVEPSGLFEADAMAVEALFGTPRADLPSKLQFLMNPLRRLVIRFIRVYWVQQLRVDRAILTALRTLRRDSRNELAAETARLRGELKALSDRVDALRRE